ncbi:Polyketide cyclase SnoaL-like domain-containing protein [Cinnamomum micranthum f. kanehirae]|uniref:Polyketide cyclase SnoaL-like domain-containing protein n=1 Tax=Cinnamomum micranthum f. kanehirae TaxID=337451 RepID=A0A443PHR5_9MAGN|nr:Polyketide cyclase SnoaL-like domain-containing protein [Cinnamomum micranthum f. kanehirae]
MQAASLLNSSPLFSSPSPLPSKTHVPRFSLSIPLKSPKRSQTPLKSLTRVSSSQATTESPISPPPSIDSASDVVKQFYSRINGHDLDSVANLIAENCVYEDLVFSQPFVGRKAILDFFKKFTDSISTDLQFVIDDISSEDSSAVGVTWHLEWRGRPFPFSKGCSFYRLEVVNGQRQIVYGRDSVEPAIKPGEMALMAIGGVTRLLESFPQLADRL